VDMIELRNVIVRSLDPVKEKIGRRNNDTAVIKICTEHTPETYN